MARKVKVFIAQSVDGYIADRNHGLAFLDEIQQSQEAGDYGHGAYMADVDTVIMGRKTYDIVRGFDIPFPHAEKQCFVFSRTRTGKDEHVQYINEDIPNFVKRILENPGKTIAVEGGGEIIRILRDSNLIDAYMIFTIPVFLGQGIPLFLPTEQTNQKLTCIDTKKYDNDVVFSHYVVIR